jgi:hypothetical protein
VRFAYADPPYPGQARRHYGDDALEVNLELLVAHLEEFDGWALSTSSVALRDVLPLVPSDTRVMAWVKPFCSFKPNVNPAYAWEPVLVRGGRHRGRDLPTVRDYVSVGITLERGVHGAKPEEFCYWIFEVLGMELEDEFVDLFPGSGAVGRAWEKWCDLRPRTLWETCA